MRESTTFRSWRRSSFSASTAGNCVEVHIGSGKTAVRDSKNPSGGHLTVSAMSWRSFIDDLG